MSLPCPSICNICDRDYKNGACGTCTITRQQLDHVSKLGQQNAILREALGMAADALDEAHDDIIGWGG